MSLKFEELREKNVARCEDVFHKLNEWSPTDWGCAMGGECGEALNEIKKLRRLDSDHFDDTEAQREELRVKIGKELADVVIYADLVAARLGLSLSDCVRQKFNEVSDRRCSEIKL